MTDLALSDLYGDSSPDFRPEQIPSPYTGNGKCWSLLFKLRRSAPILKLFIRTRTKASDIHGKCVRPTCLSQD